MPATAHQRQDEIDRLLDHRADREGGVFERHLAALDLRHVQHVVDDPEQVFGRDADLVEAGGDPVPVAGVQLHDLGHADDGIHRRADFMGHVGEEAALGLAGELCRLHLRAQLPPAAAHPEQERRAQQHRDAQQDDGRDGDHAVFLQRVRRDDRNDEPVGPLFERDKAEITVLVAEIQLHRTGLAPGQDGADLCDYRRVVAAVGLEHGEQPGVEPLPEFVVGQHDEGPLAAGDHIAVALLAVELHEVVHVQVVEHALGVKPAGDARHRAGDGDCGLPAAALPEVPGGKRAVLRAELLQPRGVPGGQAVVLRQRRALLRHDVEAEDRVAVQLAGGHLPHLAGARAARGDAP